MRLSGIIMPSGPTEPGSLTQYILMIRTDFDRTKAALSAAIAEKYRGISETVMRIGARSFLLNYVRTAGNIRIPLIAAYSRYVQAMGEKNAPYLELLRGEIEANRVPASMLRPWTVSPEDPGFIARLMENIGAGKILIPAIVIIGLIAAIQIAPVARSLSPRQS